MKAAIIIAISVALLGAASFACQESQVIFSTKKHWARLTDIEGKPLPGKTIRIRKAPQKEFQLKSGMLRMYIRGEIVGTRITDDTGKFNLKGFDPGMYWLTYMDEKDGQSFLVQIESGHDRGLMDLRVNAFDGLCYLEDVERNVRKPDGWGRPFCNEGPCEDTSR